MFCPECGNKVEDDCKFCVFCGAKLTNALTTQSMNSKIDVDGTQKKGFEKLDNIIEDLAKSFDSNTATNKNSGNQNKILTEHITNSDGGEQVLDKLKKQLKTLKEMKEEGLLSNEEYEQKRKMFIDGETQQRSNTETSKHTHSKREEVIKCPNCGEIINSFETKCSSCGYELRGVKIASVLKEFTEGLNKFDEKQENCNFNCGFIDVFTGKAAMDLLQFYNNRDNKIKAKAEFISHFAIPNSKEDVFEFMILASTNLNTKHLKPFSLFHNDGLNINEYAARKMVAEAWLSKMKQAYQKAKLSFSNERDFENIKEIYNNKMAEIK